MKDASDQSHSGDQDIVDRPHHKGSILDQSDERFDAILAELTRIKDDNVVRTFNWFKRHARRPMILFRTTGVLIIVLSVSVPFLGVLGGTWTDTVLPIVALAIAGLTGLSSFFQWQGAWQRFRQTQFALEHLISMWELRIIEAKYHPDRDEAAKMALQATKQLLEEARAVSAAETQQYFEQVEFPKLE